MKKDPYRVFPPATNEERERLKASIAEVGLQARVIIDEKGDIIDGHDRRDVCEELGLDWKKGADARLGLSEEEKYSLAVESNLFRKNISLNAKQRNEVLERYLIANPKLSDNRVAVMFGVSQSKVNRLKIVLSQNGKLKKPIHTVGRDGKIRKVGNRKRGTELIIKNAKEFDRLEGDLPQMKEKTNGLIRRPLKLQTAIQRDKNDAKILGEEVEPTPPNFDLINCDFRELEVEPESIDLILTDPMWHLKSRQDWIDMAALANKWLKDDGRLVATFGTHNMLEFADEVRKHLHYEETIAALFDGSCKKTQNNFTESWRPYMVFSKSKKPRKIYASNSVPPSVQDKTYGDWQQPLEPSLQIVKELTKADDKILDVFLGTGTNAVAVSLIGERSFLGCDVDPTMVKKAKLRLAKEGKKCA